MAFQQQHQVEIAAAGLKTLGLEYNLAIEPLESVNRAVACDWQKNAEVFCDGKKNDGRGFISSEGWGAVEDESLTASWPVAKSSGKRKRAVEIDFVEKGVNMKLGEGVTTSEDGRKQRKWLRGDSVGSDSRFDNVQNDPDPDETLKMEPNAAARFPLSFDRKLDNLELRMRLLERKVQTLYSFQQAGLQAVRVGGFRDLVSNAKEKMVIESKRSCGMRAVERQKRNKSTGRGSNASD